MAEQQEVVTVTVRMIRRATRKKYSADEKMPIVLEEARGESIIQKPAGTRVSRRASGVYYRWSKEFLDADKERLIGDTARQADEREVNAVRQEIAELKQSVAELSLKNRVMTHPRPSADRRLSHRDDLSAMRGTRIQ